MPPGVKLLTHSEGSGEETQTRFVVTSILRKLTPSAGHRDRTAATSTPIDALPTSPIWSETVQRIV